MRFATRLSALALAGAGLVAAAGAQAQSMDVRVTGTVTPPACIPALAGGGVVDYGNIPVSSLNATTGTHLGMREVAFTINCDAPTRLAMRGTDNRSDSVVSGLHSVVESGLYDVNLFGLGAVRGKNVGAFLIRASGDGGTIDGEAMGLRYSANNGSSWGESTGWVRTDGPIISFARSTDAQNSVRAFTSLSSAIQISAVVGRADNLDLTDEVPLDGLATLEMIYL